MDRKESILIVDDDENTRRVLTVILGKKGYETETAGTGREAREKAQGRLFNLAMLDIRLPDMKGTELIAHLKEMHPDMVVIMVRGYASLDSALQALNDGASAYITKPLDTVEVLARVREALEKQRLVVENRRLYQAAQRELAERRQAEKELRKSGERYRLLAENARDVIWTMDMNLRFTYVSPSVRRLRGYSVEEVMAQTLKETMTPASLEVAQKALAEELAMESMELKDLSRSRWLELEKTCKDGSTVWTEVRMTFLRDQDNRPVGILGVTRDITERKQAEKERLQGERLQAVLEMAGAACDELNQPLQALTGLCQLALSDSSEDKALHKGVKNITEQVDRMVEIARKLNDLPSAGLRWQDRRALIHLQGHHGAQTG